MSQLINPILVQAPSFESDSNPTTCLDSVKLNSIHYVNHNGKQTVIKQRNNNSSLLCKCSNLYFYLAQSPIRFFSKMDHWKAWEIECFEALNGEDHFQAYSTGPNQISFDKLAGDNLWNHALGNRLTLKMVRAAAREFQRAHKIWMPKHHQFWSHGDAGLSNLIYEEETERVRFIDFELRHIKSFSIAQRHADDLLVFLQDLMSTLSDQDWLLYATTFLKTYANKEVIAELKKQLVIPPLGFKRLWWHHRTSFAKISKMRLRYAELQRAIDTYLEDVNHLMPH